MHNRIETFFDEHARTRERVRGLAELSPEATAYEVTKAIREGRMSQYRDQLDYEENMRLWSAAKVSLAGAAFVATAAMLGLAWVLNR